MYSLWYCVRTQGVSCLSITDPGDSDIIRTLPGQARKKCAACVCVWVNVLWKYVIYIIDVDVYDMWQKFKDLPWRLARSEQALRNHFSLRNRPGGYIPIFANVLSTVSNCWTWSILNMYMRIDIYVPGAGSPPLTPHPWSWIPQPLCWRGLGWVTVFCAVCSFCPPFPFGVGWGGKGVVHAVWEYRIAGASKQVVLVHRCYVW